MLICDVCGKEIKVNEVAIKWCGEVHHADCHITTIKGNGWEPKKKVITEGG